MKNLIFLSSLNTMSLTGLSQRVAYFYPTGVTLLHTSSPSPFRAWLRAVARAWICIEVTRAPVAGRGLVWHRARFHQPRRRAQPRQEEHTCAEPRLPRRGTAVVARQGRRENSHWCIWDILPTEWPTLSCLFFFFCNCVSFLHMSFDIRFILSHCLFLF